MVITDPVGDMLVRIRNAGKAGKTHVSVPFSDLKLRIANVLLREGFVSGVEKKTKKGEKAERVIEIGIVYESGREGGRGAQPRVQGMVRTSRPSRRIYIGAKDLKPVKQGLGIVILSTPKGILTGEEARKEHVGGEVLCKVW
jgi:small subunit ribosomal protein S8